MKHSRHVSMSGLKTPTSVLITPVVTITPVPLRYQVTHRTLQFPHNTFISTHIHAQWTPKKEREKETKEDLKKQSPGHHFNGTFSLIRLWKPTGTVTIPQYRWNETKQHKVSWHIFTHFTISFYVKSHSGSRSAFSKFVVAGSEIPYLSLWSH